MARLRLTKTVVDKIPVSSRDQIVWDTVIAGFGLKVATTGKRTYFMKYRTKSGRQRKPTIGVHGAITCEQAREIVQNYALLIATGADPMRERDTVRISPTIEQLCNRVIEEDAAPRLKRRSVEEAKRLLRNVIAPKIGSLKTREISRADIQRFHAELKDTKPQANRTLAFLSKCFNLAERWGLRDDGTNPCRHVSRYQEHPRTRFLSHAEIQALWTTLHEPSVAASPFAAFIKLALLTGCRKSEILNLRWSEVDFAASVMRLPDSKTGPKTCVLNDAALQVLKSIKRQSGQVFVIAGKRLDAPSVGVQKWWERTRIRAGLHDCRVHTLRHTHGAVGTEMGLSLNQVGNLLGHKDPHTTFRYAHHQIDTQRRNSNEIANAMLRAAGEAGPTSPIAITDVNAAPVTV